MEGLSWVGSDEECTYAIVECVAVPIPSLQQLDSVALIFRPLVAVRNWSVEAKNDDAEREEDDSPSSSDYGSFTKAETADTRCGKVEELAHGDDGKVKSWKVVVQKQLSLHEVEGEVMERPAEDACPDLVVEASKGCLLYTSPSPRDGLLSRMPSSA